MAWIFGDSFDFYAAIADAAAGHWDTAVSASLSSTTRFGVGKSIRNDTGSSLTKAFGSNEATVFAAVAHYRSGTLTGTTADMVIGFRDGATPQCTVVFESSGNIVLKSGSSGGTVIATYTGAFSQEQWNHFQIKVVINNTTGSIAVRKNGATSDSFSATGLNTRGGTANNYANALIIGAGSGAVVNNSVFDDLLVYSAAGAAPNDWVGDVRAVQLMPSADTAQKQFNPLSPVIDIASNSTASTRSLSVDTVYWSPAFTADCSGTVGKCTANFNAAITGNVKAALYANDGGGGVPGTLLATSNAVVNPVIGINDFTFASPPSVTQGNIYYIAYLSDTAWVSKSTGATATNYTQSQSYASGFPSYASTTGGVVFSVYATASITVTSNATLVDEAAQDGDATYVYSSTNGHEDLYDLADLAATPTSIVGVQSRMFAKKSDSGTRNGQIRVKSGGTEVGGTDTALSTSYTWLNKVDTVDPNTSAAWTASAVNALQVGPKVTA